TACFRGIDPPDRKNRIKVGAQLRFFGDGFQFSKNLDGRRFWRVPVMDGEFLCDDVSGTVKGIGGGNLLICGTTQESALAAARSAVDAIRKVNDVILPFPSGIVRAGSKIGSKYPKLKASTNDKWCPTLRGQTATQLEEHERAVYEIVVDGLSVESVGNAMKAGLDAATAMPDVVRISAGNYGGKLAAGANRRVRVIGAGLPSIST
ncbi:MAG: formylmethanofuran--tetrahydromethanopterin N-formyltransferase, partial [Planctomycetota bacterium]